MVYLQQLIDSNLYRVDLTVESGGAAQPLAHSTRVDASPDVSPDGSRIVFASNRTGSFEIWRVDADGGNARQLTDSPHTLYSSSLVAGWPANRILSPAIERGPEKYLRPRRFHWRKPPHHRRII